MKKKFLVLSLLVLSILVFSIEYLAVQDTGSIKPKNQVIVYYFYSNFRCSNCMKIEQYSTEAVGKYFKDEIKSGKVIFKSLNIEEKGNEHFAYDYKLYTKSLVISLIKDGKEIKYSNLAKIWEYLGNKEKFYDYVKDEINKYLKE